MMTFVLVYAIGVGISALGIFLYEYLYLYDRQIRYISGKEVIQDVLLSLLSWIMVAGLIFSVAIDIYLGWPSKGFDLKIKKIGEAMKNGMIVREI